MENNLPFEKIKRNILVKSDNFVTSDIFGCYPDKRPIQKLLDYGIVNVDKPQGPTSHQVSDYVKKILHLDKAGHSGTLDPNVTGCLPTALSKGTRVVSALLIAGKEYVCIMHVHESRSEQEIRDAIKKFVGKIRQLPPVKSAVKREWRTREIYYIDVIEIDGQDVLFRVGCEAGTYIRKLCTDLGKELNTGAHMVELRRTKAGPFNVNDSVTLTALMDAYAFWKGEKDENGKVVGGGDESYLRKCVIPFEHAISHLGKIWVFDTTIDTLCHGAPLNVPGIAKLESGIEVGDSVAVLSLKGELVCIGDSKMNSDDIFSNNHGCVISMMSVFMPDGTYPKFKREKKEDENKDNEKK